MDAGPLPAADNRVASNPYGRHLDEVLLLLEHLSGHPSKSVGDVEGLIGPLDPSKPLTGQEVLVNVARIAAGEITDHASALGFLFDLKDKLNQIAAPATGYTIAYTTMCATPGARVRDKADPRTPEVLKSRMALACGAFPGLADSAWWLRRMRVSLIALSITLAFGGCYLTWQVAYGRSILQRITELTSQNEAIDRAAALDERIAGPLKRPAPTGLPSSGGKETMEGTISEAIGRFCSSSDDKTAEERQICQSHGDIAKRLHNAFEDLYRFENVPVFKASCPRCQTPAPTSTPPQTTNPPAPDHPNEQVVATVLTAFNSYILPVIFAMLGSFAALMRTIYGKIEGSTLAPRDLTLFYTSIPLGLVAGVSIGLFLTPTEAPIQGAAGLTGGLTLSAPGIAFLAGYGTEAVFRLFDMLLTRVFTVSESAKR